MGDFLGLAFSVSCDIRSGCRPFSWLTLLLELRRTDWIHTNGAGPLPEHRGCGGMAILDSRMFKSVTENANKQRETQNYGIDLYKCPALISAFCNTNLSSFIR